MSVSTDHSKEHARVYIGNRPYAQERTVELDGTSSLRSFPARRYDDSALII
jgi:hypothetical protein